MKKNIMAVLYALSALLALSHCTVLAQSKADKKIEIQMEFQNVIGDQPLKLKDQFYTNNAGEKFNITTFNYFISNIKLRQKNGMEYTVPQDSSYFLLKDTDPQSKKLRLHVPKGKYTSLSFTIGVDSLRNTMDISRRTGALDISGGMLEGMYWTWNSGYIFMKLEGDCDQAQVDRTGQKKFRYHIGGFGGYSKPALNNIRTITLDLTKKGALKATQGNKNKIVLQTDALLIFNGPNELSIATNSAVMFGPLSQKVAENYSGMFRHIKTEN
jgi:hypothetical protein